MPAIKIGTEIRNNEKDMTGTVTALHKVLLNGKSVPVRKADSEHIYIAEVEIRGGARKVFKLRNGRFYRIEEKESQETGE